MAKDAEKLFGSPQPKFVEAVKGYGTAFLAARTNLSKFLTSGLDAIRFLQDHPRIIDDDLQGRQAQLTVAHLTAPVVHPRMLARTEMWKLLPKGADQRYRKTSSLVDALTAIIPNLPTIGSIEYSQNPNVLRCIATIEAALAYDDGELTGELADLHRLLPYLDSDDTLFGLSCGPVDQSLAPSALAVLQERFHQIANTPLGRGRLSQGLDSKIRSFQANPGSTPADEDDLLNALIIFGKKGPIICIAMCETLHSEILTWAGIRMSRLGDR